MSRRLPSLFGSHEMHLCHEVILCEDSAGLIGLHMFILAEVLQIAGPAEVDDGLRFLGFKYPLEN